MIRHSRTLARFVWYHVPLRIENVQDSEEGQDEEQKAKAKKEKQKAVHRIMAEKRMALELIEACVPVSSRYTRVAEHLH